jgi:plastocyanin
VIAIAGCLAFAAACGGSSTAPGGGGGGGGGGCSGTQAVPAVCDNFYSPDPITITAGSSVTWHWKGAASHSVTFTSGSLTGTGSATMSTGTFTQNFSTAGTYTYQCAVHGPAMSGTVQVN